jgi:hypothetical protein
VGSSRWFWFRERTNESLLDDMIKPFHHSSHTHTRYPRGGGIGGSKKKEEE